MRSNGPMGLVIWDGGSDFYSHTQLAANWDAIEGHDHTPGKGVQLQTNSLANNSVIGSKIAPDSITTTHILNKTILAEDIGDHQIGLDQLDPAIFNSITPLGTTIAWFRPDVSISVPTGWVISDGSVVDSNAHGWSGFGNIRVPDLQGKFVLGAATDAVGSNPSLPPVENEIGGANVRYFNHTHSVAGHSHVVNAHSHSLPWHSHPISVDGHHNHGIHSRMNAFDGAFEFKDTGTVTHLTNQQSIYIAGFNTGLASDAALPMVYPPNDGAHSHGGSTQGAGGQTSSDSTGTDSVGLTTNPTGAGGDIRPAYVGLLYITKIRHA